LVKEFSLERVTPSPAVFDMQKLYWLNRHYIKEASPERIHKLALAYYERDLAKQFGGADSNAQSYPWSAAVLNWFGQVTDLLVPSVDRLEQLPERAAFIFHYNAAEAQSAPENADVLAAEKTGAVIAAFAGRIQNEPGPITAEQFKAVINEVKAETGAKGKELFHPIRIIITGSHSGPEFDKLIPIIETGSTIHLPSHVLSVRERVAEFAKAKK
jgi:nondiscriminating glutamyl-tRNA synthetase